jgi:hypothetical protein
MSMNPTTIERHSGVCHELDVTEETVGTTFDESSERVASEVYLGDTLVSFYPQNLRMQQISSNGYCEARLLGIVRSIQHNSMPRRGNFPCMCPKDSCNGAILITTCGERQYKSSTFDNSASPTISPAYRCGERRKMPSKLNGLPPQFYETNGHVTHKDCIQGSNHFSTSTARAVHSSPSVGTSRTFSPLCFPMSAY